MNDQARNLNPHRAACAAMYLYGAEYARSGAGSMDFWDRLDAQRKRTCRDLVAYVMGAREETARERSK